MGLYVAICLLCGLYLLASTGCRTTRRRAPERAPAADGPVPGPGLLPAAGPVQERRREPAAQRTVFAWVDSFLLPEPEEPGAVPSPETNGGKSADTSGKLAWIGNLPDGLTAAQKRGSRIFIDFTGMR